MTEDESVSVLETALAAYDAGLEAAARVSESGYEPTADVGETIAEAIRALKVGS